MRTNIIWIIGSVVLGIVLGITTAQLVNPPMSAAVTMSSAQTGDQPSVLLAPTELRSEPTMAATAAPTVAPTVAPTMEPTAPPATPTAAPAPATGAPASPTPTAADQAVSTAQADADSAAYGTHIVKRGDVLARIAKQYNVSVEDLLAANSIANPNSLTVGTVLRIPRE